jgi:hypothetical protein
LRVLPLTEWHARQRAPWYAWLLWNYWYDAPMDLAVEGTRCGVQGRFEFDKWTYQRLCHWNSEYRVTDEQKRKRQNARYQARLNGMLEACGEFTDEQRALLVSELPAWLDEMRALSRLTHTHDSMQAFLTAWNGAPRAYIELLGPMTDWYQQRERQADRVERRYNKDAVVHVRYRAGLPWQFWWDSSLKTTVTTVEMRENE